jgi:hypothetical protein
MIYVVGSVIFISINCICMYFMTSMPEKVRIIHCNYVCVDE